MRNEQKAIKIVEQYETRYNDTRDLLWTDLEDIAVQAMQWKEQQMIDKAVEWLALNAQLYGGFNPGRLEDMVTKFTQAMKEE